MENSKETPSERAKRIFDMIAKKNKMFLQNMNKIQKKKTIYCTHYKTDYYIYSKCCNKIYPCRICHDENENHKIDRYNIDLMFCSMCNCLQKVNSYCINKDCCNYKKKSKYYCKKCNLWTNDLDKNMIDINHLLIDVNQKPKEIYHCDECNICRLGKKEDYIHCKSCNLCISKKIYDSHPCKINAKEHNCMVCLNSSWSAVNMPIHILNCGHLIHSECMSNQLASGNYKCPLCKKCMVNMELHWRSLDNYLEHQVMPEEYQHWTSDIYCFDCQQKSNTKYHFIYHKCQSCNGYNTTIENLNK